MDQFRADLHARITDVFEDTSTSSPIAGQSGLYVCVLPRDWEDAEISRFFRRTGAEAVETRCSFNTTAIAARCGEATRERLLYRATADLVAIAFSQVRAFDALTEEKRMRSVIMYYLVVRTKPRVVETHWDADVARLEFRVSCKLRMYRIKESIDP